MKTYWPSQCIRIDRQPLMVIADNLQIFECWYPSLRKEIESLNWRCSSHCVVQFVMVIADSSQFFVCWRPTLHKETKSLSWRCSSHGVVTVTECCRLTLHKETETLSWCRRRHSVVQAATVKTHLRWLLTDTQSLTVSSFNEFNLFSVYLLLIFTELTLLV